jgi:hypothetical protein
MKRRLCRDLFAKPQDRRYSFAHARLAAVDLAECGGKIEILRTPMIRVIWHRAAALALPVTLAICLPPMAVIAFSLHAKSRAASAQKSTADSALSMRSATARVVAQNKLIKLDEKRTENSGRSDTQTPILADPSKTTRGATNSTDSQQTAR